MRFELKSNGNLNTSAWGLPAANSVNTVLRRSHELLEILMILNRSESATKASPANNGPLSFGDGNISIVDEHVGVQEQYDFSPLGVNFYFYANYVNKFSFVLYTNIAAMQTTYWTSYECNCGLLKTMFEKFYQNCTRRM